MCSRFLLFLVLLLVQVGCSSSPDEPASRDTHGTATEVQEKNQRDAVLVALSSLDEDAMRQAFASLSTLAFTTRTRTEQRNEQGQVLATSTTTARHVGTDSVNVLDTTTTGRFAFGWLARFSTDRTNLVDFASLPDHVLPDDPPYLSPRNRDAYAYTFLPDTVMAGQSVRVIEVQAKPDSDQEQTIQWGRFYLTPHDTTLLALDLERQQQGLLFREESRFSITLRPKPDSSGWLPASLQADVHLKAPFRPAEQFRTTRSFSDFAAVQ